MFNKRSDFISVPQVDGKCSSTGENIVYDTNKLAIIKVHRHNAPFFNCGNLEFPLKIDKRDMGEVVLLLKGHHGIRCVFIHVKMNPKISDSLFQFSAPFFKYNVTLGFHVGALAFTKTMNSTSTFSVPVIN
jgi:hypothetical protein